MESIRRLHEEILKREYKAEKQRKEEMRYDQMDCLLLAGEEKTERTIPVCETVFPEKFADLNAVREVLLTPEKQVYALIAPAFMGQFGEGVSPGAIRAALKRAGFSGMVEVAVFADILTLKEALEFDVHISSPFPPESGNHDTGEINSRLKYRLPFMISSLIFSS